jgi:hypothetical protein
MTAGQRTALFTLSSRSIAVSGVEKVMVHSTFVVVVVVFAHFLSYP